MVGAAVLVRVLAQAPSGAPGGGRSGRRRPAAAGNGLPLAFHEDFSAGEKALQRREPTEPKAWRIEKDGERSVLAQFAASEYSPAVRSPFNIACIRDLKVGP